ncbi:MAG: nucleotidyltransferase domain-containing protein [Gammaproteobacteria bacterium]|nr:MAG: nucleotidyltransferase domain-containing protein [Gammaproteobacteria bacterium]
MASELDDLQDYLQRCPEIKQAIVFGSLAKGQARFDSDVDLAIEMDHPMSVAEKAEWIAKIAQTTQRAVDLIDLFRVGQPLFLQIIQHGKRLKGSDAMYGRLLSRCVMDYTDFMPYRQRILDTRRHAWIGS